MGFLDGTIQSPSTTIVGSMSDSSENLSNLNFLAWKRTDRLIKGWTQAVGLETNVDVWSALKRKFSEFTIYTGN